jgi:hypothetical protein
MMKQACMKLVGVIAAMFEWFAIAMLIVIVMAVSQSARAQSVTFGASATNANGELSTVLTWDAPGASRCIASGHPAWDGERMSAGTQALPAITLSGTYSLSLACTWQGDTTARLSWTPPTQNTDGTSYVNPKGFTIHYGDSPDALAETVGFFVPTATSYLIEDLSPGVHYFCVRSVNLSDATSECSAIASKTTTADQAVQQSVSLTVNPVPREPTDLQAQ